MKPIKKKPEIDLFDLLVVESTDSVRNLLDSYGVNVGQNEGLGALKTKLAELYFSPKSDKVKLEKELADIHPHKKWITKTLKVNEAAKPSNSVVVAEIKEDFSKMEGENKSCSCGCSKFSDFTGGLNAKTIQLDPIKNNAMEIIGLVAVIGLTFYLFKNN